jgi:hypothetical protein
LQERDSNIEIQMLRKKEMEDQQAREAAIRKKE